MRRAPIVLSATALGLAAVLGFKPREAPSVTRAPPTAQAAPATPATPSAKGVKTATGDSISTRYGDAQVRVTVTDGKITEIEALQLQSNDPKSVQISTSAEPLLRESALTRQTAAIDAVSGATITSASYQASLQSALDKAGFEAADGSRASSEIPEGEEDRGPGFGP